MLFAIIKKTIKLDKVKVNKIRDRVFPQRGKIFDILQQWKIISYSVFCVLKTEFNPGINKKV